MDTLKVATYNIQLSMNADAISKNILSMARSGVVVFCLQEILKRDNSEFIGNQILKVLGPSWQFEYCMGDDTTTVSLGTAILWNKKALRLLDMQKYLLPKLPKIAFHERMFGYLIGFPKVAIQRRAVSGYFAYKDTTLRITSFHSDHVGGSKHRINQLRFLLQQQTVGKKAEHEVVCGDFNTIDLLKTGIERQYIQKALGESFEDASKNISWSADLYNMDMPHSNPAFKLFVKSMHIHIRRKLDYIWVKNCEVLDAKVLQIEGSDHYPLTATLRV